VSGAHLDSYWTNTKVHFPAVKQLRCGDQLPRSSAHVKTASSPSSCHELDLDRSVSAPSMSLQRSSKPSSSISSKIPNLFDLFFFFCILLFILVTCRSSQCDLHLLSFSLTSSTFEFFQIFFIRFVVKSGVPGCSSENFHPAGLPIGRLVTRPRESNITFRPQCKDKRKANLTTNYGKKRVS